MSKRGATIASDLGTVRTLLELGMQSPKAASLLHDGDLFLDRIAEAVHAGVAPSSDLENETRGFMRFTHRNFGASAFGHSMRSSGVGQGEAFALIASGSWDPFEDAELPD